MIYLHIFHSPWMFQIQKNEDPSLSQPDLEEAFADHDKDGSGSITLSEWQAPFEETVETMLNGGDADGELSEEERIAHHREEFNSYDKNVDGFLDATEIEVLANQIASGNEGGEQDGHEKLSGAEILKALDVNADGKVDFEVRFITS